MASDADASPADPLANRHGSTAELLASLTDDELDQYIAYWRAKWAEHDARGDGHGGWWCSKSVSGGEAERRRRAAAAAELVDEARLLVHRGGVDEFWVRGADGGWRRDDDPDGPPRTLEAVLHPGAAEHGDLEEIEVTTVGSVTAEDVAAALPEEEGVLVVIDGRECAWFPGAGWLPVALDSDPDDPFPEMRTLASISFEESGGFTSGAIRYVLGELRPGLLIRHHDIDEAESGYELIEADPVEYVDHVRSLLVDAGYETAHHRAATRALRSGGGFWDAEELDPDGGSPTREIWIDIADEFVGSVLPEPAYERSFWLDPWIAAGAYPGSRDPAVAERVLEELIAVGVTLFLDLTEPGELEPYEQLLPAIAEQFDSSVRRVNIPVRDVTAPTPAQVEEALAAIDAEVEAGGVVYVHCWGGKGRTGSILGCHLARDLGGAAALERLNEIRGPQMTDERDLVDVPETPEQRALVLGWPMSD